MALKNGTKRGKRRASTKSNYPVNSLSNAFDGGVHNEQHQIKHDARANAIESLREAYQLIEAAANKVEAAIGYTQNYYRLTCEHTAARATQDSLHHVLYTTRRMVNAILDHGAPVNLSPMQRPEHHI